MPGRAGGIDERSASWFLPAEASAVATGRSAVALTLGAWNVHEHVTEDVALATSELLTNAVLHGSPPIEMRLRRGGVRLVLEVEDAGSLLPRLLRPTAEDEHGRGLHVVASIADRWGTRTTATGKCVWCTFAFTGAH